ncbi:hypothetical protein MSPP1_001741 [Malassezia sp. CBS 17886]|nr:hypothetical protein MSPP1_001741 [Malassezia sp. CBS 17886]
MEHVPAAAADAQRHGAAAVETIPEEMADTLSRFESEEAARIAEQKARLGQEHAQVECDHPADDEHSHTHAGAHDVEKGSLRSIPNLSPRVEKEIEAEENDPFIVSWESTDSVHENPRTWSLRYRLFLMLNFALFSLIGPFASSMISPAQLVIAERLHFTNTVETSLLIGIFMLAFTFGPPIAAPVSETIGRRKVVLICNIGFVAARRAPRAHRSFIAFNIGCAVSQTKAQLIVLRFFSGLFGGAVIPMGGGCISDMFSEYERGTAMAIYAIMPVMGPCCGPIVGGWIIQAWGEDRWRWIFWTSTMLSGAIEVIGFLFARETYTPVLLKHKAKKLRSETNDMRYHTRFEKHGESKGEKARRVLLLPLVFLFTELVVLLPSLYMALIYGCFYLIISTLPTVYQEYYGYSPGIAALHNVSLLLGFIVFGQIGGRFVDWTYVYLEKKYGHRRPEFKLPLLMFTVFVVPAGLLIFGWTARYRVFWFVPDLGLFIVSSGVMGTLLQVQMYMADVMGIYGSSAISATIALRSFVAFIFTLFAHPMVTSLKTGWESSVLALVCAVFGIPAPFLLWHFGPALRSRSKFCVKE